MRTRSAENVFDDYSKLIANIRQITSDIDINSDSLSEIEQFLLKNIKDLTDDYPGACRAYCLLNDYFVELELKNLTSNFASNVLSELNKLHETLVKDSRYNWFGTPNVNKLIDAKMYGGEKQFGQRMQVMIVYLAKNAINARKTLQPQLEEMLSKTGPINQAFLDNYVTATLSPENIKLLDELDHLLWEHTADFVTVQTTLHFYRFIIAAISGQQVDWTENKIAGFVYPRSAGMPLKRMHAELEKEEALVERLLSLIPEGELKDFFLKNTEENPNRKKLEPILTQYFGMTEENRSASLLTATTPLSSEHYQYHMKQILKDMDKKQIIFEFKIGLLPHFNDKKNFKGKLFEADFCDASFGQHPDGRYVGEIHNKRIAEMSPYMENWKGESIYRHFSRLYTIALLTNNSEVAKAAWCRFEWWYSNVMPYGRGSAAIGEAVSKTLQLSHFILPTQMRDILPDLRAIFQYDEEDYVEAHDDFFLPHQYHLPGLLHEDVTKLPKEESFEKEQKPKKEEKSASFFGKREPLPSQDQSEKEHRSEPRSKKINKM